MMQNLDVQSWGWLGVFLLGLLGLFVTVLGFRKNPISGALPPAPSPLQQEEDKKSVEAEKKLEEERSEKVLEAKKEHDTAVDVWVEDLRHKTEEIKDDPKAVNESLLDIGKEVRGGRS